MSAIEKVGNVAIDQEAILKALNLNPRDPKTQALLVVCERYQLDPLLKHMVLISGNPYITRDGYLAVAHRSGQFDGMEVVDSGEDQTHWWAKVAVWRKDMSHPFTYEGRYPKNGHQKNYGREMAIKCAEVMGLRRAFNVTGVGAADERWDEDAAPVERSQPAPTQPALPAPPAQAQVIDVPDNRGALSTPRTFPAPGAAKNHDEFTLRPGEQEFTDEDETLANTDEMAALRKELASLDDETMSTVSKAWVAAGLPSIKSRKQIDKADYERALTLVLEHKEAAEAAVQQEDFFKDDDETGPEAA